MYLRLQLARFFSCAAALGGCVIGDGAAVLPALSEAVHYIDAAPTSPDAGVPLDSSSTDDPDPDGGDTDKDAEIHDGDGDGGGGTHDAGTDAGASDAGLEPEGDAGPACEDGGCPSTDVCVPEVYGEHEYLFCTKTLTWDEARAHCIASGLDLTVIDDAEENAFVAEQLATSSWIGANDRDEEDTWMTITPGEAASPGVALGYESWGFLRPDDCLFGSGQQDCARITDSGKWDDSSCEPGCNEGTFAFVCESY